MQWTPYIPRSVYLPTWLIRMPLFQSDILSYFETPEEKRERKIAIAGQVLTALSNVCTPTDFLILVHLIWVAQATKSAHVRIKCKSLARVCGLSEKYLLSRGIKTYFESALTRLSKLDPQVVQGNSAEILWDGPNIIVEWKFFNNSEYDISDLDEKCIAIILNPVIFTHVPGLFFRIDMGYLQSVVDSMGLLKGLPPLLCYLASAARSVSRPGALGIASVRLGSFLRRFGGITKVGRSRNVDLNNQKCPIVINLQCLQKIGFVGNYIIKDNSTSQNVDKTSRNRQLVVDLLRPNQKRGDFSFVHVSSFLKLSISDAENPIVYQNIEFKRHVGAATHFIDGLLKIGIIESPLEVRVQSFLFPKEKEDEVGKRARPKSMAAKSSVEDFVTASLAAADRCVAIFPVKQLIHIDDLNSAQVQGLVDGSLCNNLPPPAIVVQTSSDSFHAMWLTVGKAFRRMRLHLIACCGGKANEKPRGSVRIPGSKNKKSIYPEPFDIGVWVNPEPCPLSNSIVNRVGVSKFADANALNSKNRIKSDKKPLPSGAKSWPKPDPSVDLLLPEKWINWPTIYEKLGDRSGADWSATLWGLDTWGVGSDVVSDAERIAAWIFRASKKANSSDWSYSRRTSIHAVQFYLKKNSLPPLIIPRVND